MLRSLDRKIRRGRAILTSDVTLEVQHKEVLDVTRNEDCFFFIQDNCIDCGSASCPLVELVVDLYFCFLVDGSLGTKFYHCLAHIVRMQKVNGRASLEAPCRDATLLGFYILPSENGSFVSMSTTKIRENIYT